MSRPLLAILACAVVVGLLLFPGACSTPAPAVPTATPPPAMPGLAGAIVAAGQADARLQQESDLATIHAAMAVATLNAARLDAEAAQLVPLAQAQATSAAIDAAARLQQLNVEATASAWSLRATTTAEAQQSAATAQSWSATATTMARDLRATAQADRRTATAEAWAAGATVEAGYVQATIQAAAAEREQMALARERTVQPLRTYGPWVAGALGLALLAYAGLVGVRGLRDWLRNRAAAVPRDERGDAQTFIQRPDHILWLILLLARLLRKESVPGLPGTAYVDPDKSLNPGLVVDGVGTVTSPQTVPVEQQERVTAGDQVVDVMTRGLPGGPARSWGARVQAARRMVPAPPRFVILRPDQPPPPQLVDQRTAEVLDAEWEEEDDG